MKNADQPQAILIGTGVMSAHMAMFLHLLQPTWKIKVFERLDGIALESTDAWNNAGTGHAAFCELNYTPAQEDGSIDCHKALKINRQYTTSLQFWAYLAEHNILSDPSRFIHTIPHHSFVFGEENVIFLRKRYEILRGFQEFKQMEYTEDPTVMKSWFPLMMDGRDTSQPMAATRMRTGTDVNFGELTRQMFDYLTAQNNTDIYVHHDVVDVERHEDGKQWNVTVLDLDTGDKHVMMAAYVFIGAGGGALDLLDKSGIPEADGYGGFPISGQWLRCINEDVVQQHQAKVYGKAASGTPPMSVPHLDTRIINGKKELLFGPFAGFSTKFLKKGSYFDLFKSLHSDNIIPMLQAGWDNIPLTKYLISQVTQSHDDRMEALREFMPHAKNDDWELKVAGQRVQVIKDDEARGGVLEFGTEVVHAADGTLAALLGASPGASTAASIILDVLEQCFGRQLKTEAWHKQLEAMIPSYYHTPNQDDLMLRTRIHQKITHALKL